MKTSILRRVCPYGLSQVCVGWWGESNLNGVVSSKGGTRHIYTHTHTHKHSQGKSYHHTSIVAYGPFQWTPLLQRGWKHRKWVEPPLRCGVKAVFAIFRLFLSGVSNWASEIGEIDTSREKVTKQIYFLGYIYMNREIANREQMIGPEGGFISFHVCTKHKTSLNLHVCCVCVQAGTYSLAVISLVIYGCDNSIALAAPCAGFQM